MGNSSAKSAIDKCAFLTTEEKPVLAASYKMICQNGDKFTEENLMKSWSSQMDPRLAQYIINFLFGPLGNRSKTADYQRFAELFVYCVRGSVDESYAVVNRSLGRQDSDTGDINYPLIKEYVEAVVSTCLKQVRLQSGPHYNSWESVGFRIDNECVQKFAENLAFEVVQHESQKVSRTDIERWIQCNSTFLRMVEKVFIHLYRYRCASKTVPLERVSPATRQRRRSSISIIPTLLPFCEDIPTNIKQYPAFTDIAQIMFIDTNLPHQVRNRWRFLFSSQLHGESFSALIGKSMNNGPCVIIIEDSNGFMFGGHVSHSLSMNPKFYGDDTSFLFTLKPKMRCFTATGYNDHYQYLNLHQQTLPNGFGMGGQFNFWGLWLDSEFGLGECSESCTTYKGYFQMSSSKNFKIKNIEIWAVGEKQESDEDESDNKRTILDGNLEEKAILSMIGKTAHSDGYREEPTDD